MFTPRSLYPPMSVIRRKLRTYSSSSTKKFQENTVKIGQWDINYLKTGQGPHHVLCLPGTLGTIWTDYKGQIEGFDKNKFTLVVCDPPGYGKSRPPLRKFAMDSFNSDAVCAYELMKALNIPKYSILGWSGGGVSGLIHAAKYPETMEKLVVWGSPSFILPHEVDYYRKLKDIDVWSEQMKTPFLEVYGKELLASYWSQWADIMIAIFYEKRGDLCSHLLKHIQCPTLVLHGEKDRVVDPVHARHLVKNISDARLYTYPEGKHNLHLNYGNDFNMRVQEFLQ